MALINCEECGKEISSKAVSCPHCGFKEKKTGCLGMLGYLILSFFLIALLGKCVADINGVTDKLALPVASKAPPEPPEKAAADFFKLNASDKVLTCGKVVSAVIIKDTSKARDSLVTCSNGEKYRFVQEHMNMFKGKPKDWWAPHAFKCSDLKATTLEGWHNPKDWGITKDNCSTY